MVDPIDPGGSAIAAPAGRATLRTIALRRDWHDAWRGVVLGLGLLIGSWLVLGASHHTVAGWERWLFRTVNDLPDPLRWILWPPMQLGSAWAWIVAFPVLALIYRRLAPCIAAALAGWSAHLIAQWAKATVDRARPEALLADVQVRTLGADEIGRAHV